MLQNRWGKLKVDVFASEHSAKLPKFYSRFWCPNSVGVYAFTQDWSKFLGLYVPPIILIPGVLKKMTYCKATGASIVSKWKSAILGPMIFENSDVFQAFIH